ncbi:hypothetical protein M569_11161, partial [Genlisea aurea]
MESWYVTLLTLFLIAISLLHFFVFKSSSSSKGQLPPGTSGWPVLGESIPFLSTTWKGHPHKFFFDRIDRYSSKVFRTNIFGEKAAVFSGAAGNKYLFSHENKTVQSWLMPSFDKIFPSTINIPPRQEGLRLRKLLPGYVKAEALSGYIGIMDEIGNRHFAEFWENKESVVVVPTTKRFTFLIACRLFLSIDDPVAVAEFAKPFNVLNSGLISFPINLPGTAFNRAIKASKQIRNDLALRIRRRREEMLAGNTQVPKDILTHMVSTTDEDGKLMDEMDIACKIVGLLVAGHDTTSTICTFIVKFLAELPHVYEAVYQEHMKILETKKQGEPLKWEDMQKMKYSWNVACEALRLYPPVQGGFREAIDDFNYNGFHIPKGWKIYWSTTSSHRNPEHFPDPEKFEPSRFEGAGPEPYSFIPFGGGPRMCPGKEYSRLEVLIFIHHLVKRYRWEKIIPDEKITINPFPAPVKGLPIRLFPH